MTAVLCEKEHPSVLLTTQSIHQSVAQRQEECAARAAREDSADGVVTK